MNCALYAPPGNICSAQLLFKSFDSSKLQAVKLYAEEKHKCWSLCSLEEFVESYIIPCECCGELVLVDDADFDELPIGTMFNGKSYRCCRECYECSIEYENSRNEEEYEII